MMSKFMLLLALGLYCTTGMAHEGESHKKKEKEPASIENQLKVEESTSNKDHVHDHNDGSHEHEKELTANFDDFPTLHPLVVHFPIVLLLLAFVSQFFSFFVFKDALSWVTLGLITFGFIGAYVAGNNVHPHTSGLSDFAEQILTEHESYADYSIWLSGIGVVLKVISQFFLKRKLWSEIIVAAVLFSSAATVGATGHYGAQLIHIEGVGAAGKNLETDGHDHEH